MTTDDCDLLILGASFAGIELLHQLRRSRAGRRLSVTIVDRQAAHGYIPLCQERLLLRLPLAESELATRRCVDAPGTRYLVDEVVGLTTADAPALHEVQLASGTRVRARFVVVALGSDLAAPAELPGREHLLGYKLAHEFTATQPRLFAALERPAHIVVIGGGISGVELAGELAHLARARPPGSHPPRVTLVDGGDRLLRNLTPRAGRMAARQLTAQGVQLRLRTRVLAVEEHAIQLQPAGAAPESIAHDLAFWAGGVRPAPVLARLDLPRTASGFLAVGPTLQCFPTHPRSQVFGCGDAVRVLGGTGEWPTMQRAIECLWQAKVVARNILTLATTPADRHPVLQPHSLTADFPHGVSVGAASMIVYGRLAVELGPVGICFRRFLMRQYFRRYGGHKARPT